MAEASIPVDLFNPGQVFACLGFMEAADILLGDVEGGFDWSDAAQVRFLLKAAGDDNPFAVVLEFLAQAEVHSHAPVGYGPPPSKKKRKVPAGNSDEDASREDRPERSETFPSPAGDRMALPVRLKVSELPWIVLSHWSDGSRRDDFKLYGGNRSAASIARALLRGTFDKAQNQGVGALWRTHGTQLVAKPFDLLTRVGGSFNFDPRGAWTAIDAGYSPDRQKKAGNLNGILASPTVEILAALGLEHARPDEYALRQVRYAAWRSVVPLSLARPALSGANVGCVTRTFHFTFGGTKHNKVVTFAQEEIKR